MTRRRKGRLARALRALRERPGYRALCGVGAAAAVTGVALYVWPEPARRAVARALEPASMARVESYAPSLRAAAEAEGLDPCLLAAIVYAESRGKPDAVSSAGALGLMQLMPASAGDAARALGLPEPSADELLSDPELNIRLGARHFAWTLRHEENDPERALCAYNAGRGRLGGWIREAGTYELWRAKQVRDGDSQVLAYAQAVLEQAEAFRRRGAVGGAP